MCGICGVLSPDLRQGQGELHAIALRMAKTLEHRGPDDFGVWTDPEAGVALGFRRLAILDLSAAGKQPMRSACDRYIIVYNGEIYNFLELRQDLESLGHTFRGHSDTEVLLAAIVQWGIEDALRRCNGMFAFAVWDRSTRTLTLARDRLGKKPLYYGWFGDAFLFGSELKAFRVHPSFDAEIDRDALGLLVQYGWIPAPYSIFTRVRKLPAATLLTVVPKPSAEMAEPKPYWSAREVAEQAERGPFTVSAEEVTDALDALLRDAVKRRMIADVELGALLSGGIDSTCVVAMMQAQSERPVKTFTVGFDDPKFDEAANARELAGYLGTDHTELYVSPEDGLRVIPELPWLYDEPFADSSQIPTALVCRLARRAVTVALSGDGGDELFGGYPRYFHSVSQWNSWKRYPLSLRRGATSAARFLARRSWEALGPRAVGRHRLAGWKRYPAKLERHTAHWPATDPVGLFARTRSHCRRAEEFVIGATAVSTNLSDRDRWPSLGEPQRTMMYLDLVGYLPDDILVKTDRASMGASLELRSPLLDYRVVEFALGLPLSLRMGDRSGKRILRKVLERYVPRNFTERPKRGFSVPISSWLRGPLREWAGDLLEPGLLREQGYFREDAVLEIWRQHLTGWHDRRDLLWSILMFQAWHASSTASVRQATPLEAIA